jgi:hypothetical protein
MVDAPVPIFPAAPAIAEYRVIDRLAPETYLCGAPGQRQVVLKKLDDDCLLKGQLHPAIADRLGRVQELAHPAIANLHGVRRDPTAAWLMWEWIPGQMLEQFVTDHQGDWRPVWRMLRDCIDILESIHERGLVHGAVHERNFIVDASGLLRLTHASPLLYTDEADDTVAIVQMIRRLHLSVEANAHFDRLIAAAEETPAPLAPIRRWLNEKMAADSTPAEPDAPVALPATGSADGRSAGRWSLVAAGVLVVVGALLAAGLWRATARPAQQPLDPPSIRK